MKVAREHQLQLLELQRIETELAQITRRSKASPCAARVAALQSDQARLHGQSVELRTEADDLDRAIRRAEADLDNVRERFRRDEELLGSGVGAKMQTELEHELQTLRRRKSELEDAELELMERQEQIQADQARVAAKADTVAEQLTTARSELAAEQQELHRRSAELAGERQTVAAGLPAALVQAYQRSKNSVGIGAALFVDNQCQGCRLSIPAVEAAAVLARPLDEVDFCEECGCILVREA